MESGYMIQVEMREEQESGILYGWIYIRDLRKSLSGVENDKTVRGINGDTGGVPGFRCVPSVCPMKNYSDLFHYLMNTSNP